MTEVQLSDVPVTDGTYHPPLRASADQLTKSM
jgi:hypothetical protein